MRVLWLLSTLILPVAAGAQSTANAPAHSGVPASSPADSAVAIPRTRGELAPAPRATLRSAPGDRVVATLDSSARVQVLAHDRGWTRIRLDGWIRDEELRPANASLYTTLSAADLRADPDGTRGKTVRWLVQVIALQTADPLRRDLAPNEPYLLAKGPGSEDALLYLAVPPSLLSAARDLDPLSTVTVVARVRVGRSAPSGVPILDIERIAQR